MKNLRLIEAIVLLMLLFSSCTKDPSYFEGETKDGNFILIDEVAQRVNNDLILKVTNITDTRCPVGTVCTATGYVKLAIQVYVNKEFKDLEIIFSALNQSNSDTINGYNITVLKVTPHPYVNLPEIDSLDYRVIVAVNKL